MLICLQVELHNAAFARGDYAFNLTTTTMADLTYKEYALLMLGVNITRSIRGVEGTFDTTSLPQTWDWRQSPQSKMRARASVAHAGLSLRLRLWSVLGIKRPVSRSA